MVDIKAYDEFCNEHICSKCPYHRDDNECLAEWTYHQGKADAIEPIMSGYPDFKALESLMLEYFERVDLTSEKTDIERLALEIVTRGMQTLGCLNGELEQLKEKKNGEL